MADGSALDTPHRRPRRWLRLLALGVLLGVAAATPWLHEQWRLVSPTEAARLDREALHVHSRPLVLAVGDALDADALAAYLDASGYREHTAPGELATGHYRRQAGRVELGAPGELQRVLCAGLAACPPGGASIRLDGDGSVLAIRASGAPGALDAIELPPPRLASVPLRGRRLQQWVSLSKLPPHLVDAVLVTEDRRFFEHEGLDFRRIAGSVMANLRAGEIVQGGSTITQQLVKNRFLTPARTYRRKAHESLLAVLYEIRYDKAEILEHYLNEVYLGQARGLPIHGVGMAARHYFGRAVWKLTEPEAAFIAGLLHGPNQYRRDQDWQRARARRNLVLAQMAERGMALSAPVEALVAEPLGFAPDFAAAARGAHYIDHLTRSFRRDGVRPGVETEVGRVLVSALDYGAQRDAERVIAALLPTLQAQALANAAEAESGVLVPAKDAVLQASLVALDPATGEIRALVGGRDSTRGLFDRATRAARQPGSAFKPLVTLAALSGDPATGDSFSLATPLQDTPFETTGGEAIWAPQNHSGEFSGEVTLRDALQRSLNVPFARLGAAVGHGRIERTARALGLQAALPNVPSLALGTAEVTLLDLSRAYLPFAQGYRPPVPSPWRPPSTAAVAPAADAQGLSPGALYLVSDALRGVVTQGTARALPRHGYPHWAAGKTGSSSDYRDAWFIGYNPALLVGVWVGFDNEASLGGAASAFALPVFAEFMAARFPTPPLAAADVPAGLERHRVLVGAGCEATEELFLPYTPPPRRCVGFGTAPLEPPPASVSEGVPARAVAARRSAPPVAVSPRAGNRAAAFQAGQVAEANLDPGPVLDPFFVDEPPLPAVGPPLAGTAGAAAAGQVTVPAPYTTALPEPPSLRTRALVSWAADAPAPVTPAPAPPVEVPPSAPPAVADTAPPYNGPPINYGRGLPGPETARGRVSTLDYELRRDAHLAATVDDDL